MLNKNKNKKTKTKNKNKKQQQKTKQKTKTKNKKKKKKQKQKKKIILTQNFDFFPSSATFSRAYTLKTKGRIFLDKDNACLCAKVKSEMERRQKQKYILKTASMEACL